MSASNSPPTEGTPKVTPLSWMISISAPQLLTKGSTVGPLVQSSEADVRPVNQLSVSWRVSWVTCTHSGSQWPGSLRAKSFRGCSSLGLNSACELQSCLHLSCWLHPVACQPWIYLDFLPDCWVTGAEDSVSGILLCWHPLRPRMWSQRKPLIMPNIQLTDKMTLPLLDFLCCCLCTISFLFLLMFGLYPVAYETSISSSSHQFGSTEYYSEEEVENSVCCSQSWVSFFSFFFLKVRIYPTIVFKIILLCSRIYYLGRP